MRSRRRIESPFRALPPSTALQSLSAAAAAVLASLGLCAQPAVMSASPAVCYAITGGCGYVGYRLALALVRQQPAAEVRLLDIRPPPVLPTHSICPARAASAFPSHPDNLTPAERCRLSYRHCDLTAPSSLLSCLSGVQVVYHVASYGMSGAEMLDEQRIQAVNVEGTHWLLAACRHHSIRLLVYVSTYNVVYCGQRIEGGDERLPYPPLSSHPDAYARSKTLAEQAVIAASAVTPYQQSIRSCILRPAAIYGDGEERHLPRILRLVQRGLAVFAIGDPHVRCDWLYIDNLTHALVLAAERLRSDEQQQRLSSTCSPSSSSSPSSSCSAPLICYISDDAPTNNFVFLSSLLSALGYSGCFLIRIPTRLMYGLAAGIELLHALAARCGLSFSPFITRAEVLKVGVTHWMRVTRAREELRWRPVVDQQQAVSRCTEWFAKQGFAAGDRTTAKTGCLQLQQWRWLCLALLLLLLVTTGILR
jgi:nucleoside-diphosphate-sugar epimerase